MGNIKMWNVPMTLNFLKHELDLNKQVDCELDMVFLMTCRLLREKLLLECSLFCQPLLVMFPMS